MLSLWRTEIWLVLLYSHIICFHHIVSGTIYSFILWFSIVWKLVFYPVQKINWWFLFWPPEIVNIVDGSYCHSGNLRCHRRQQSCHFDNTRCQCNTVAEMFHNFNSLRPRQNGRHFPDDIFKCFFLNENIWIRRHTIIWINDGKSTDAYMCHSASMS